MAHACKNRPAYVQSSLLVQARLCVHNSLPRKPNNTEIEQNFKMKI